MISIKTEEELAIMKEGGKRLAWVMKQVLAKIAPGVEFKALDRLAESLIKKQGGKPSFKMVKNYHWATCINLNQGVVHGIPGNQRIKKGDLVSLDMGIFYRGFHTDMARTLCVRTKNLRLPARSASGGKTQNWREKERFLKTGRLALKKAIGAAKPGNRVGHISQAIEKVIKKAGFSPVKALTGHGIGRKLHESPQIPCYLREPITKTEILKPGITLAIEVIYNQGGFGVVVKKDGWTVETEDGKLAALFEDTIVITPRGSRVLT